MSLKTKLYNHKKKKYKLNHEYSSTKLNKEKTNIVVVYYNYKF